jgi:hypothetical protein
MILFDMVTQTWWRQYHISSGWFVDSIPEDHAIALIKKGWPLKVDDIQAINAASVESYIRYRY